MTEQLWTKEEQKEHRKLWIETLRSGEYKQTSALLDESMVIVVLALLVKLQYKMV